MPCTDLVGHNSVAMGSTFQQDLTMAFQPIVDVTDNSVFGHEALVRGPHGETAASVLLSVKPGFGHSFDQQCQLTAINLASRLHLADTSANLTINFIPSTVHEPSRSLTATLAAAEQSRLPIERIIFECRDGTWLDVPHTITVMELYRSLGFLTGLDNFCPTRASLEILSRFRPDFVKIDRRLIRDIDTDLAKHRIVAYALRFLSELGVRPICGGVETYGELSALTDLGVGLVQGFLFARPAFERFATPRFPA